MDDIIELAEGVAESLGEGAEVSFAPEFDLKSLKTKKLVVVPVGIESKPNARDYLEDRYKVQVGLLKKCTEDDVPGLVREVVRIGLSFLQKAVGLARKFGGEWNETLREALEDPELEKRVRESMSSSMSSPGSSE